MGIRAGGGWRAAVVAAVLVVLPGCGGGDGGASALPSTAGSGSAESASASSPAVTPTSVPSGSGVPSRLPEASRHDDVGAKAFGVYFVRVLDHAYRSQDAAPLTAASADSCRLCRQVASSVSTYGKPGYVWRGGLITVKDLSVSQPGSDRLVVVASVSISELVITDPAGHRVPYSEGAHPRAQLMITEEWAGSGWIVTDLALGT